MINSGRLTNTPETIMIVKILVANESIDVQTAVAVKS